MARVTFDDIRRASRNRGVAAQRPAEIGELSDEDKASLDRAWEAVYPTKPDDTLVRDAERRAAEFKAKPDESNVLVQDAMRRAKQQRYER